MRTMAVDALVRCRVSSETKDLLQSIAAREQITESAVVRQLLETLARTSATEVPPIDKPDSTELRAERLSIRLAPDDRLLLRERASARGMPSATYVAVLVRSHLRKLTPLPVAELDALKRSIAELGAVGRNLNQIARTLNAGGRLDGPGRQDLAAMLKIAVALRDHIRALLKANETSWERGYGQTTD
jgi:antitoxin component of RelBE/YafQ-DinJ toxin-antitoxin module